MPRINLLPWRETQRKVRRREFMVAAGAAVFAAGVFVLGGTLVYSSWTDAQIKENGNKLEIHGVAQSSTRVSTFMRNIDGSMWMDNPQLQVVESGQNSPNGGSSFTLIADAVGVNLEDGGESKG